MDGGGGAHRPPLGSTVGPCPARTWVMVIIGRRPGRSWDPGPNEAAWSRASAWAPFRGAACRRDRSCSPNRRGRGWSCASVRSSGNRVAVGVNHRPLARADAGFVVHRSVSDRVMSGPRIAVGVHPLAGAGGEMRGRVHGAPPQGLGVPFGSMVLLAPARRCVVVFIAASSGFGRAVRVHAESFAGPDARGRVHRRLLRVWGRRWGPCPSPCRPGDAW